MSDEPKYRAERPWHDKFRDACRGLRQGVQGQSSFFAHFFIAAVVIVAAWVLEVTGIEWCILLLCIGGVLVTEMINSALESMAKAITHEANPHVGGALDIGGAAVLIASVVAAVIGSVVFLHRLGLLFGWDVWVK